ncbi:MAG: PAS domain S-box protein [Candidatus Latescibacteria bacterium]|nr:PAS domain S-box protein [Candidatus Latescibacterota bacterium]
MTVTNELVELRRRLAELEASEAEHRRIEESLRQRETHYQDLYENAPLAYFSVGVDGHIREANQYAAELLGCTREALVGRPVLDLYAETPAGREKAQGLFRRFQAGAEIRDEELEMRRAGGRSVWVNLTVRPLREASGQVAASHSIAVDITARKQAEEILAANEAQLAGILDTAPEAIISIDAAQHITLFNKSAEKIFGYTAVEAVAKPLDLLLPEDLRDIHRHRIREFARSSETARRMGERQGVYGRRKSGEVFPAEASISKIAVGREQIFTAILWDISEHRRWETEQSALKQVREEVFKMQEADDIQGILLAAREGLEATGVSFRWCGINVVDESGEPIVVSSHNMTREGVWESIDNTAGAGAETIVRIWRAGETAYRRDLEREDVYQERSHIAESFGYSVRSVLDIPFFCGTLAINNDRADAFSQQDIAFIEELAKLLSTGFRRLEDLRTLKAMEQQLSQSQKMEAIGQLAGGVAHDFNNLITIISGYSDIMLRALSPAHPHHPHLKEIQQAADRGAGLVRQLLAFSRKQVLAPKVLDLNTVVKDLEKMLHRLIGEDVELVTKLAPDLGQVKVDPGQMEQVLINLAVNARDAMPQGGKLIIETSNTELDETYAARHAIVKPGPYVLLAVSDTGTGMDEETQKHIFEPFFTTKELGKGTGLGLATVYGLVKQSGGYIWVYSEPGKGTSFKIYLPRVEEGVVQAVREEPLQVGRGAETVLLVEDERALRELAVFILREAGYTVLEAGRGDEALQLSAAHQGPIHLVVTDMVMPGMSGRVLVERLVTSNPELKVLYMSGYSEEVVERQGALGAGAVFLHKPFISSALLLKVREALHQTS